MGWAGPGVVAELAGAGTPGLFSAPGMLCTWRVLSPRGCSACLWGDPVWAGPAQAALRRLCRSRLSGSSASGCRSALPDHELLNGRAELLVNRGRGLGGSS